MLWKHPLASCCQSLLGLYWDNNNLLVSSQKNGLPGSKNKPCVFILISTQQVFFPLKMETQAWWTLWPCLCCEADHLDTTTAGQIYLLLYVTKYPLYTSNAVYLYLTHLPSSLTLNNTPFSQSFLNVHVHMCLCLSEVRRIQPFR